MIVKILTAPQWSQFQSDGVFAGSEVDRADGFIHFSTPEQLPGTLEKHYAGQCDLWAIEVDEKALGDALKWEISRGGEKFPHLYGVLMLESVSAYRSL